MSNVITPANADLKKVVPVEKLTISTMANPREFDCATVMASPQQRRNAEAKTVPTIRATALRFTVEPNDPIYDNVFDGTYEKQAATDAKRLVTASNFLVRCILVAVIVGIVLILIGGTA